MLRKIVQIDVDKCNGCGLCVPNCAEGAIKIIDGKARLVSEKYCDGLGACLGHCPQDAITIIEREADDFDEFEVKKYLEQENNDKEILESGRTNHNHVHHSGCPGSRVMFFEEKSEEQNPVKIESQLRQWPVQLTLVPFNAPYLNGCDLLITADCVPYAYANYHQEFLKGKSLLIGCPKLDDVEFYIEKLTEMFKYNDIRSVAVAYMEVPCCGGLVRAIEMAMRAAHRSIPLEKVMIGIQGERLG